MKNTKQFIWWIEEHITGKLDDNSISDIETNLKRLKSEEYLQLEARNAELLEALKELVFFSKQTNINPCSIEDGEKAIKNAENN